MMDLLELTIDQLQSSTNSRVVYKLKDQLANAKEDLEAAEAELEQLKETHNSELIALLDAHDDFKRGIRTLGELLRSGDDAAEAAGIDRIKVLVTP